MKVNELEIKKLITIDSDDNLRNAMKIMEKHGISRLMVKQKDKIVGILTERDVSDRIGRLETTPISDAHLHVSSAYSDKLVKIREDANIRDAANTMLEDKISSLAVTDKFDNITGIITKTDIVRTLENSTEPVSTYMNRRIVNLKTGSSLMEARKLMMEHKINKIVVTFDSEVVGILAECDIAEFLGMFRKVSKGVQWFNKLRTINVEDIMSTDVVTVKDSTTIGDAVKLMTKNGISGLPVVDDNNVLKGILTKTDMMKAIFK